MSLKLFFSGHTMNHYLPLVALSLALLSACAGDLDTTTTSDQQTQELVADAGPDQIVDEGNRVNLSAGNSLNAVSYFWVQSGGSSAIDLNADDQSVVSFDAPLVDADSVYTFRLTVSDSAGNSASDEVSVTVIDSDPAVAVAEVNASEVNEGEQVQFSASSSQALGDATIVSYKWQQVGENSATTDLSNSSVFNLTAPNNLASDTILTFRLTVVDDGGTSDSDEVELLVNNSPTAVLTADQLDVNEGDTAKISAASSSDSDNGSVRNYFLRMVDIDGQESNLSNSDLAPEYSYTSSYVTTTSRVTFLLTVTDNDGASSETELTLGVLNNTANNKAPQAQISATNFNGELEENSDLDLSADSSSDSDGVIVEYLWEQMDSQGNSSELGIDANISYQPPNIEFDTNYTIVLTVTDDDGESSSTSLEILILNLDNEVPIPVASSNLNNGIANEDTEVILSAEQSYDDAGIDNLEYLWQQVSSSGIVVTNNIDINKADEVNASFIAPNVDEDTNYTFRLTLTDANDSSASDEISILVNNSPTAETMDDLEVNESSGTLELEGSGSDTNTFWYKWTQSGGPALAGGIDDSTSATASFTVPEVDFDTNLTFLLTVEDEYSATDTSEVVIAINNSPTADAGENAEYNESRGNESIKITLDGSGSNDTNNTDESMSYQWQLSETSGNADASVSITLENNTTSQPTFTAPEVQADTNLTFQLTVTDNDGVSATDSVVISINNAPSADADENQSVNEGILVTLDGSASEDTDNGTLSYDWQLSETSGDNQITVTSIELDTTEPSKPTFTAPEVNSDTNLTFQLTVSDDDGASDIDSVIISINNAPSANAGINQEVDESVVVTLDGSISSDTDDGTLFYDWQLSETSGDTSVSITLENNTTAKPTFTAPEVNADTNLTFQLTVSDDDGASDIDSVVISINNAPSASAGANAEYNESRENQSIEITLDGSDSNDTDGGTLSYDWQLSATSGDTDISITLDDSTIAQPTFIAPEVQADTNLTFQLTVTDNDYANDTATVVISINNAPSADAGENQSVNEGVVVTLDGSASNDTDGGTLSYLWLQVDAYGAQLDQADPLHVGSVATISEEPSNATFTAPVVTRNETLYFRLTVTDNDGAEANATTTIDINNSSSPSVTALADFSVNEDIKENVTLDISASSGGISAYSWKQINAGSNPVTITRADPDDATNSTASFTAPSPLTATITLTFEINATDQDNNSASDQLEVTITNLEPVIDLGTTISAANEGDLIELDASASSGGITSYSWQQVDSDGVSVTNSELTLSNSATAVASFTAPGIAADSDLDLTYYFAVTVSDAEHSVTSDSHQITIANTFKIADANLSASVGISPDFDQINLSWDVNTSLTYSLHRTTDSACDISAASPSCAGYASYAQGSDIIISDASASFAEPNPEFFTSYYYWLEAQLNDEVVLLSSTPTEATTTGPVLNDTGITSGGDYPSGFDTHNSLADGAEGAACNGGYLIDEQGAVIADPSTYTGTTTFVPFTNEDCEIGRDANTTLNDDSDGNAGFSFTRLNSDGSEYSGNGDYGTDPWACVVDNLTGLIWEVKTNDGTLRDRDEGFTWHDPDNETFTGTESSQDTADFVEYFNENTEVNSGSGLCGRSNWRLPTVQELVGISDFSNYEPVVDTSYFPNARTGASEWSWTADLNSDTENLPGYAWLYSYYTGSTRSGGNSLGATSNSFYVRLVSSSAAVKSYFNDYSSDGGRYTDHEDGTVSDNRTGLMWMKCIYGQAHNSDDNSCGVTGVGAGGTWQEAFAKAAAINEGAGTFGYTDWRLPNMKELLSLVDLSSFEPPINQGIFPSTDGQSQWTSTLSAQDGGDAALAVGFSADPEFGVVGKTVITSRFRLVRDDVNTPRILTVTISDDNIINASDSSNLGAIPVSGSTVDVEDAQQITLVVGSETFYIDVSADAFEDTIDLSDLNDGTYSVTADVSDTAGRPADQFTDSLLLDTTAPTIASVSATTGTYGISASVPLTLTANEIGLTLTSTTFNGQSLGEVTDNGDGTYTTSYTVIENDADIADGDTVEVNLAFTDQAGNLGAATTSITLSGASIDANRPTIASVDVATGTHGIGDSVAITITAGANESGLTLTSVTFNGATLATPTDNDDGTYTTTYVVESDDPNVADGGAVSVNLAFTDPAGNAGIATSSVTLDSGTSIDTTPPTQTISDIKLSDDSGASDTDFLTKEPDQIISATLSADLESGDTLHGSVDSGANWEDITNTSVSDTSINWATTLTSGEIQFKVVDAAGNDGEIAEQTYTLDEAAPTIDTTGTATSVDEGSGFTLNASSSTDDGGSGIASYTWTQVQSDGSSLTGTALDITNANTAIASVIAPGIADDSGANLSLYFAVTITDKADNSATSSPITLTVSNTYKSPDDITASTGAPGFDQISLSWPTTTGLTYDLHRSSASSCDLSATNNCADYQLYTALDLSSGAQIDSGLDFFSTYYYWLGAQLNGEVVYLSSTPTEANTTGPALNDTGVTQGGDYPSGFDTLSGTDTACNGGYLIDDQGAVIADPSSYEGETDFIAFEDEDCELGRDADTTLNDSNDGNAGFSFTRLYEDGSEYTGSGDYTTEPWSCVVDNVTGLIWEVKTNDNTLRDRDLGFTWYDPDNETFTGTESSQDTADFVEYLNENTEVNSGNGLCGQSNWRLPTVQELVGISDFSTYEPVVDTSYFPNARTGAFEWSWTADLNSDTENYPNFAWLYNYETGSTRSGSNGLGATINSFYVRLVSSSAAVKSYFNDYSSDGGRYTDHGDGTVSDNRSGLMWMKCIYGQAHNSDDNSCGGTGAGAGGTWQEAFAKAAAINEGVGTFGYTDWRLPNMKELLSLVDLSSFQPPINQNIFPNTDGQSQWTSTLSAQDGGDAALAVGLGADPEFGLLGKTTTTTRVRLVRDDVNTPRILTLNINGDNVINSGDDLDNIPVSGSTIDVEDGQILSLAINTNAYSTSAEIKADGSFTTTIDLSGITDGTYSVTADVSDTNGKAANQFTGSLLVDTVAPTIASVSATAGIYKINASVPLTLTASESGLTLTSNSFNGQSLGEVTDNNNGTYTTSYTVIENDADIADGGSVITNLAFTDPAGNIGTATESIILSGANIDANRPTIASVSVEAGIHGIGDSVAITITAGSSETGLDLTSATFNGATLGSVNDKGDGTYTATYTVEEGNAHVADGGSVSVDLVFTDPAGNTGTAFESVTLDAGTSIDTTPPTQIISDIDINDDSGALDDDFLTNIADQTITATLSAGLATGDTLHGSVDSGINWENITNSSVSGTSINWATTIQEGSNDISFRVTDSAGNVGTTYTQSYILDTAAPTISISDVTADEGSTASLDSSNSSDSNDIASYAWAQVESDGSALTGTALDITNANSDIATVTAPGIADDTDGDQSFYFAVTITDKAGNPNTSSSSPLTLTVTNTYTTPAITATAVGAPDFNQISLSWSADTSLDYYLYRSTDSNCDLSNYNSCTNPTLYTNSTGITISGTSASITDTDSSDSFQLFTSYYYWLGAQIGTEVVSLNSTPLEATNSGPVINDTGITGGGDYPSGFDNHNGLADGVEGAVCNGGYLESNVGLDNDSNTISEDVNGDGDTDDFIAFTNEDCELGRDANTTLNNDSDGNAAFVFTKLDIDGTELAADASSWACVLDHTTGLIWEVKTTDGTLRDPSKFFTWYNPNHGQTKDANGNDIDFSGTESDADTQDFIDYVNGQSAVNDSYVNGSLGSGLCGSTDWRLPTVHEIKGLADYDAVAANGLGGYSSPSIDTDYFPHALASQYNWYWTSHLNVDPDVNPGGDGTVAGSSTSNYYAWAYNSAESRTRSGTGSTVGSTVRSNYVRLVSSSAAVASHFSDYSDDRYTDNGDGTISDARTGLMWMQCSYGQTYDGGDTNSDGIICEGSPTFGSWQQAFAWAADSNANVDYGYNDWRLPNIKELGSIVDFGSAIPAINQSIFPNTSTGSYWTSTPSKALDVDSNDDTQSASIWFHTGDHGLNKRTANLYLRLVRNLD